MKTFTFKDGNVIFVSDNSNIESLSAFYNSIDDFLIDYKRFTVDNLSNISFDGEDYTDGFALSQLRIIGNIEDKKIEVAYFLEQAVVNNKQAEIIALKEEIDALKEENLRYRDGYDAFNIISSGLDE